MSTDLIERLKKRVATFAGRTADGVSVFVPVKEVDDAITELQRLQARNAELENSLLDCAKTIARMNLRMGDYLTGNTTALPQPPEVNSEG